MLPLNHQELAWAAGFFDGEGCSRSAGYSPRVVIGQTDPRVLQRFKEAVGGLGLIYGPYDNKRGTNRPWADRWEYAATTFESAQAVITLLWKWLSPIKREQAVRVFTRYKNHVKTYPSRQRGQPICRNGHDVSDPRSLYSNGAGKPKTCGFCKKEKRRERASKPIAK